MNDNEEKEVEALIDKQLATLQAGIDKRFLEEKLAISESRHNYFLVVGGVILTVFGLVVTVFGVVVPLVLGYSSASRADKEMELIRREFDQMQVGYKESIGAQLRKPLLEIVVDGKDLEAQQLHFDMSKDTRHFVRVWNHGDAAAKNVRVLIYDNLPGQLHQNSDLSDGHAIWKNSTPSDEEDFHNWYRVADERFDSLAPGESIPFWLRVQPGTGPATNSAAVVKVLSDLSPTIVRFKMTVVEKE